MAWMKNGRPDLSEAGPQRLVVGLLWGLALLAIDPLRGHGGLFKSPSLLQNLLLWPVLVTPFVLLAGLGQMRRRTLAIWAGVAAALAVLLVWHDITRQGGTYREPSPLLIPMSAVFFFGLHQLVAAGDEARRWIAPYDRLFGQATRQAVQLGLSLAITGLFWAVLGLGSALFALIGIKGFAQFISQTWFAYPAATLVFALAVQVSDVRAGLIDGIRVLGLNLLAWLGPLMTLLVLAFLLLLPMTGLGPLWATKAATPILLASAIVLIGLINAAYQDGQREPPPAFLLRISARVAGVLLIPLVALAAYATMQRVGQYGLTPDRVIALAIVAVAALLAVGYALAAVLPGPWMKRLEPANIAGAVLALGVLLALFTPIADPARLSVDSQVARLTKGLTPPDRFDYAFLAGRSERYGKAALAALKRRTDRIGQLAREAEVPVSTPAPPSEFQTERYVAMPKGTILPADFLAAKWRSGDEDAPNCSGRADLSCEAYLADLDGDGAPEILIQTLLNDGPYGPLRVYRREKDGWKLYAHATGPLCDRELPALRDQGPVTGPAKLRDLVIGGRHVSFQPNETCSVPGER